MFIDMHVHPAFFEPINGDPQKEAFRHDVLNLHQNSVASLEHIFNQMRCAGLDKLCLLPQDYTTTEGGVVVSNQEIHTLTVLEPERFIGFASVDPFCADACEQLEYAFGVLKLNGLKLHPSKQAFYPQDPKLYPIYEMCIRYNRPIIFHSGVSWEPRALSKYARPIEFEEVAERYPNLRICLSHFGWPWVQETAMIMLKYSNVYTDTALLYFDSAQEFYTRVMTQDIPRTWIDRSLRNQVMFGSNNPRFEQIRMAQALETLGFRESTVDRIKGDNALEFLGGL